MKDPIFLTSGKALANFKKSYVRAKKKKATALFAASAISIDGKLSDWDKGAPIDMRDSKFLKEGLGWKGLKDLSGKAYIMWDKENFYLAAEVSDSMPFINKKKRQHIWNGDAIEVVLGLNSKASAYRTSFKRGDYQIGFGTGDGRDNAPTIWNWQRRRVPTGSEIKVVKNGSDGYVLEAKIPWAFFRPAFAPAKGKKLAFDIAFDDADKKGVREKQFIWNGDYLFYKDPSVWGILELK